MVREIVRDPIFLSIKAAEATEQDLPAARDLQDTLRANLHRCVGMAANMIGESKRIIVFCSGPVQAVMLNPCITGRHGEYEAEEGCLSLDGVRRVKRWKKITVTYQDMLMRRKTSVFTGFTAQVIQHECDHLEGILI